jgi:hypothetical protein
MTLTERLAMTTLLALVAALTIGCGGSEAGPPPSDAAVEDPAGLDAGASVAQAPATSVAASPAAAAGDCPAATRITTMDAGSDWDGSAPHDLTDIETVTARWKSDKELQLVIASAPIDGETRTFEWLDPPVTGKDWVLRLKFLDTAAQVDPGSYGPAVMPYKPRRMSFDLGFIAADGQGRRKTPDFREGTAEITALTADRVCGRFDLSGKGGAEPHFEGEFVAPILAR